MKRKKKKKCKSKEKIMRKGGKKVEDDDIPIFDKTSIGKRLKGELGDIQW